MRQCRANSFGGSLNALWDTAYGQILIIKVLLVFGMVDLGAINRYSFLPQLQTWAKCP
jgi:putative copper resistance protein D